MTYNPRLKKGRGADRFNIAYTKTQTVAFLSICDKCEADVYGNAYCNGRNKRQTGKLTEHAVVNTVRISVQVPVMVYMMGALRTLGDDRAAIFSMDVQRDGHHYWHIYQQQQPSRNPSLYIDAQH